MITIYANTDNRVWIPIDGEYPYYLFVIDIKGCDTLNFVVSPLDDCIDYTFLINEYIDCGVFKAQIFGQNSYDNLNPLLAQWLKDITVKGINPDCECPEGTGLLDEYNYELTDENCDILTS